MITPINIATKVKYEEKYRVYLNQYSINGWKTRVTSLEDFIQKIIPNN
ncbi:hypothetical protein [Lutibacter citreus]|nr:hypothetical protein [Lutibacter citreus]